MDDSLEKAKSAIGLGQFKNANLILNELEKNNSSGEFLLKILQEYIHLASLEKNSQIFHQKLIKYFQELDKLEKYKEKEREINELEKNFLAQKNKGLFLFEKSKNYEKLGKMALAHKHYIELIEYYFEIKSYQKLKIILDELIKKYPREVYYKSAYIKIDYLLSSKIDMSHLIKFIEENKIKDINQLFLELYSLEVIKEELIDIISLMTAKLPKIKKDKKRLINAFIIHTKTNLVFWVYRFCKIHKFSNTEKRLKEILNKSQKKKFKNFIELDQLKTIQFEFDQNDENKNVIKDLESKIEFYLKYKENTNLENAQNSIYKIDPFYTNEIFVEKDNEIESSEGKTSEEVIRNLLTEISYYSGKSNTKELEDLERKLKYIIKKMYEDDWDIKLSDILAMIYSFGFFDLIIEITKKWKELNSEEDINKYLEISYFEAISQYELKKYYENIKNLNWICTKLPLNVDEVVCFTYLLAENLNALGAKSEALEFYQKVQKLQKNYRLTSSRINEIEKN